MAFPAALGVGFVAWDMERLEVRREIHIDHTENQISRKVGQLAQISGGELFGAEMRAWIRK